MNLLGQLRRSRWLPRIALAVVALATLQVAFVRCAMAERSSANSIAMAATMTVTVTMGSDMSMRGHCLYCPSMSHADVAVECAYPQAINTGVASSQLGHAVIDLPMLPTSVLVMSAPESGELIFPKINISPPRNRSIFLTHCVQLK